MFKYLLASLLAFWPALAMGQSFGAPEDVGTDVVAFGQRSRVPQRIGPDQGSFPLPLFTEGLWTRYSANTIPESALTEALNVLIDSDVDGVVVRRNGIAKCGSATEDEKSARGLWAFNASDGTRYQVKFTSTAFFSHTGDCAWTAIDPPLNDFSTSKDFDCVQGLGKFWCTNTDVVFWWDGTSTATVSGAPNGSLIDIFRNRIMIADISGSRSQVHLSGDLDGEDWTIPSTNILSTHPVVLSLGGVNDGDGIKCLMGTYGDKYIIGKEGALFSLYGFSRDDFTVREISREVGCLEDKSVQEKNNRLYWLSLRGVERLSGNIIERVSDQIFDLVDVIVRTVGNQRTAVDTTQADFEQGNLTASGPGAPVSSTISPGAITPTTYTLSTGGLDGQWAMTDVDTTTFVSAFVDNFDDGDYTSGDVVWESSGSATAIIQDNRLRHPGGSGSASIFRDVFQSSGIFSLTFISTMTNSGSRGVFTVGASTTDGSKSVEYISEITAKSDGTTDFNVSSRFSDGTGGADFSLVNVDVDVDDGIEHSWVMSVTTSGFLAVHFDGDYIQSTQAIHLASGTIFKIQTALNSSSAESQMSYDNIKIPAFYENQVSQIYDTNLATATYGYFNFTGSTVTTSSVTFHAQTSEVGDGTGFTDFVAMSPGVQFNPDERHRYFRHRIRPVTQETADASTVTAVSLLMNTTAYFISQCRATTDITSWGTLSCGLAENGGDLTIYVSTGSSCNEVTRTTATWNEHTNNTVVGISTGDFAAYRILFDLDTATETPSVTDCTLSWLEGETRPPVASAVYKDRYHLAYTTDTTAGAVNDHQLILDRNDRWVLWDNIKCYSMSLYERKLYCGASEDNGFVYQMDIGDDDAGAAFVSRIRTKAFDMGYPQYRKDFETIYLDLEPEPETADSITITTSYILDRGTFTHSAGSIDLGEDPDNLLSADVPIPLTGPSDGRYFQLELETDGRRLPWKLYGGRIYWKPVRRE